MVPSSPASNPTDVAGLPPPPGVTSDLGHAHSDIYKYNIVCQVLSYVVVGGLVLARTYTKMFLRPGFEIEDCKSLSQQ